MVLMYHRVAELQSDVWEIAVTPQKFEQQLQVLKNWGTVIPLAELADAVYRKSVRKNSIAITFDDGYRDNYTLAKPLLEKYNLPATFFIASGNLGTSNEFWWDELEELILYTSPLPALLSIAIGTEKVQFSLEGEETVDDSIRQKQQQYKACQQDPPTKRASLYYLLWQLLKPLPAAEQQKELQQLRSWAGVQKAQRQQYACMTREELNDLSKSPLFHIGAHTVTHPALAGHPFDYQKRELEENKNFLEAVTGKEVRLLAYPFGSYNSDGMQLAENLHFTAAVTTEERAITKYDHPFCLGRFPVQNLSGEELQNRLNYWSKK